ncbi:MAG: Crp/Fnr family transcriptional regulator [Bacteroidetes bacterium]|jgi:CRP/FNR family transcriptional regulator, polysaccharide utilization system transcription regulator|nr:Crp/Fnr family transcriptional regulator [Bacteroidota bacterium]MBT6688061.1 Crp/Fnr family transcriptional regulator [Bacteroidota bacterium]MBT7145013.1 Crp/Fnr family transcriptional regulator [Bacteroidota bacterium]MBT7492073.1 Crp/Fnr family transcriptional regulator [Bacteroidota bacterium]
MVWKKADCRNVIENQDSIFSVCTLEEKRILLKGHYCSSFKKGEIIYKQGNKPLGLIILSKGKVKIYKETPGKKEHIVRLAKPMSFIGFRALFAESSYIATAKALEDVTICVIEREKLNSVISSNGKLSLRIIKYIATELGASNNRSVFLTQKYLDGRLADAILFLHNIYGYQSDNKTIDVSLSRKEIANLSNMNTSNAIRTLSTFASDNIISLKGRKIQILDLKKLENISEISTK